MSPKHLHILHILSFGIPKADHMLDVLPAYYPAVSKQYKVRIKMLK